MTTSVHLLHVPVASSTNEMAREAADRGAVSGTLIVADRQTSGKGRLGRIWEDGGLGNCIASLIVRPNIPVTVAPMICLAAAVAIQRNCGPLIGLKWPNDLIGPDGRKVAGILAEMELKGPLVQYIVVGFGVNVVSAPKDVPTAASLKEYGVSLDSVDFAKACSRDLLAWCYGLPHNRNDLLNAWRAVDITLGRRVQIGEVTGVAVDIDEDGGLIVKGDDQKIHTVRTGDVSMIS